MSRTDRQAQCSQFRQPVPRDNHMAHASDRAGLGRQPRLLVASLLLGAVMPNCAQAQTAADSLALADAVAAVLIASEVTVHPLPPETPDAWEALLLERLWDADLPEPYDRYHWLQLRSSQLALAPNGSNLAPIGSDPAPIGSNAEVTIALTICATGEDGEADSHMGIKIHSFSKTADGWVYVDSRWSLSGVGSCDPAGPTEQDADVAFGDRIRVKPLVRPKDRVTGSFIGVNRDSLNFDVRGDVRRLALSDIKTLQVSAGRGSHLPGTIVGGVVGMVGGALIGAATAGVDGELAGGFYGIFIGGAIGAGLGWALLTPEKWIAVPIADLRLTVSPGVLQFQFGL